MLFGVPYYRIQQDFEDSMIIVPALLHERLAFSDPLFFKLDKRVGGRAKRAVKRTQTRCPVETVFRPRPREAAFERGNHRVNRGASPRPK